MIKKFGIIVLCTLLMSGCTATSPAGKFTQSKTEVVESNIIDIGYNAMGLAFIDVEYDGYYGNFNTYSIPRDTLKDGDKLKVNMVTYMDDNNNVVTIDFRPIN